MSLADKVQMRAFGYSVCPPEDPADCASWTMHPPHDDSTVWLAKDEDEGWEKAAKHWHDKNIAASLASQIDDTRLAVGSEAMQQAAQVYTYIKAASKTEPGLKPVAEQLGARFRKAGKPKTPIESPAKG